MLNLRLEDVGQRIHLAVFPHLILQLLRFHARSYVSGTASDEKSVADQVESSLDSAHPEAVHEAIYMLELKNFTLLHERENRSESTVRRKNLRA